MLFWTLDNLKKHKYLCKYCLFHIFSLTIISNKNILRKTRFLIIKMFIIQ